MSILVSALLVAMISNGVTESAKPTLHTYPADEAAEVCWKIPRDWPIVELRIVTGFVGVHFNLSESNLVTSLYSPAASCMHVSETLLWSSSVFLFRWL